jgi:hypothetical protein
MATIIKEVVIPETNAACSEWMTYFNKLEGKFGSENAKMIWLRTWQANGSSMCTSNSDFTKFLKKHDIDVSNIGTRLLAGAGDLGEGILGAGINLTKIFQYGIPILGVAVVIGIIIMIGRSGPDLTGMAASRTPIGRAMKMI